MFTTGYQQDVPKLGIQAKKYRNAFKIHTISLNNAKGDKNKL